MSHTDKKAEFLSRMNECSGLIHKIVAIYSETREDGEDLLQEILYQSWKSYSSYRKESKFSTWLYRVILNTALVYRRNKSRMNTEDLNDELLQKTESQDPLAEGKSVLITAIRELSKADRMIITLYLEGYNYREIAEISGISKENSAIRIHRIKKQLTNKLKGGL